jgi:hypothetical protein
MKVTGVQYLFHVCLFTWLVYKYLLSTYYTADIVLGT